MARWGRWWRSCRMAARSLAVRVRRGRRPPGCWRGRWPRRRSRAASRRAAAGAARAAVRASRAGRDPCWLVDELAACQEEERARPRHRGG